MTAWLCTLYAPERVRELRAAALLHDITKEYGIERQIMLCAQYDIAVPREEMLAPKTFHAKTAAALIPDKYPEFAEPDVISAVRWHTTGHAGMTVTEAIVYLADYIDMSRTFEDCVKLREYFRGAEPEKMTYAEREKHLYRTLILSFDMTVRSLLEEGTPISVDTMGARNDFICRLAENNKV